MNALTSAGDSDHIMRTQDECYDDDNELEQRSGSCRSQATINW